MVLGFLALAFLDNQAVAAPPPTGFGCYAYYTEIGGMENWRAHVKLMKQAGMNTFAFIWRGSGNLREQLDIAVEEGMLEKSVPVFAIAENGPDQFNAELDAAAYQKMVMADREPLGGFSAGDVAGTAALVAKARKEARYADQWPEIVMYNYDEPGHGDPKADISGIGLVTAAYNAVGFRCGTAIEWPNIERAVPLLDILSCSIIIGGDLKRTKAAILAGGKEFWAYEIFCSRASPELIRWHIGYWTWQAQPRSHLSWNWNGYLGKQEDMAKPQMTDRLRAYAEGRKDFEWLTATEDRLKSMREGFDWEGWPVKLYAKDTWNCKPEAPKLPER